MLHRAASTDGSSHQTTHRVAAATVGLVETRCLQMWEDGSAGVQDFSQTRVRTQQGKSPVSVVVSSNGLEQGPNLHDAPIEERFASLLGTDSGSKKLDVPVRYPGAVPKS